MIDTGHGSPILIIPGIQGRWEWIRPAVAELRVTNRVLSFSLGEVPPTDDCFEKWEAYIDRLLDRARIDRLVLAGISFGGLIAARYAARRPDRAGGLILVSTPAPGWPLDPERAGYIRRPVRSLPAFAIRGIQRLLPEIMAARPTWWGRATCLAGHLARVLRFPASPRKMAAWARAWQTTRSDEYCRPLTLPTLLITGEQHLDRVVPTASTLEYLTLIPGSRHVVLPNTGHIGLISTPKAFAAVVREFIERCAVHR